MSRKIRFTFIFLALAFVLVIPVNNHAQCDGLCDEPFVKDMVEIIARQVSQLPQGVYDPFSNRTFVVFPGCSSQGGTIITPCTADPYITRYDHESNAWATPVKVADSLPRHDSHFYPQIVIDSQSYIHVFNSGHLDPIRHFKSTVKADHSDILSPENWEEILFDNTNDQNKATYVMAFKTQANAIYLFYRQSVKGAAPDWYEPIYYIKSTDDGGTWSVAQKVIDPGGKYQSDGSCDNLTNDDGWDTIYIKGIYYQSDPEKLHIIFENHKEHNTYEDKLFYVYFDFSDERVYAPNGNDLGQCVNQNEFENPVNRTEIFSPGQQEFSETASVVAIDANGRVNIFYTIKENNGKITTDHVIWNGSDWDPPVHLFWDEPYETRPLAVEFYDNNSFDLYIEQGPYDFSLTKLVKWHHNNDLGDPQWARTMVRSNANEEEYADFAFVTNHHPYIRATFTEGLYTDWRYPLPSGKMYAWGIREEVRLYTIDGQVTGANGTPFSGAIISVNVDRITTVDATGHYTFTDIAAGSYTLTPTLTNYTFYPPTRTVTLPPNAANQNFGILPGSVSTTLLLDPGSISFPTSLTLATTRGLITRLDFLAGAVSQTTQLTLRPTLVSGKAGFAFAGRAFELTAYQRGDLQPGLTFGVPVTATIHYSDYDLALVSDESQLSLRRWAGSEWQEAVETCYPASSYARDLENNVLSVGICRPGYFGLYGPTNRLFLPLILHNYDRNCLARYPSNAIQPALSPDDETTVFIDDRDGQSDIFRLPAIGGSATNLNQTLADQDTPVFSPDGSTIAFATDRAGDWDIYLMDADGDNAHAAVEGMETDELHPSFTPDGLGVAFSSNRDGGNWDIYTTTIGGNTWARLTSDPAADRFPTFSADGTMIAFRSERDGNSEIYVMNVDGSNLHRVTNDPAFDSYPTFTPDGSGILFVSTRSGESSAYVVNLAGEGMVALQQRSGWQMDTPRLSKSGRSVVYAGGPTDSSYDIYWDEFTSPLLSIGKQGASTLGGQCDWEAGVLAYGWIQAWRATRDDEYRQWAQEWVSGCLSSKTEITHVNDGLLGYAALVAYETSGQPEYLAFAQRVADYLVNEAPRTAGGTLTHDSNRVWVDTLLGTVPFLIEMSQVSGSDIYAGEAISQVIQHAEHLQDPASGLYHHAWDESQNNPAGQVYWGRGNGWALLADVTVLSAITTTHPLYPTILDLLQKQAAGLKPLQDPSGLWHTVLTRSDSYLETSASALIGYAFKYSIQKGWLDRESNATIAQATILGVWRQVLADGTVANVSAPTWPMLTEEEYNDRPHDSLQLYGQGLALLLASPTPP